MNDQNKYNYTIPGPSQTEFKRKEQLYNNNIYDTKWIIYEYKNKGMIEEALSKSDKAKGGDSTELSGIWTWSKIAIANEAMLWFMITTTRRERFRLTTYELQLTTG